MVLESHIGKVGCRAPYISEFAKFPSCKTQHGIRKSRYYGSSLQKEYLALGKIEIPCQEMPNIEFEHSTLKTTSHNAYHLLIAYPEKGKIITQLQEVDAHSLIGNIGGYIGLFLGIF